jgi:hypothetical protein
MPDQKISLAEQIRNNLDAGLLPRVLPEKMWTGYGHGNACSGCSRPIYPAQIMYEFRMRPDFDELVQLHIGCLGIWLAELRRHGIVTHFTLA